ncbi:hypothetical protein BpHYR1_044372 [Brachionus plicatilis]|uniref:Uncharacterized protein n=1 Tax=Brachionus plicatilis TaxID=10195 RepID=A0A3M7ST06_BRAPC|nr:hypothetical protein BpHYR1_044372 [Brachionus plicatilis]
MTAKIKNVGSLNQFSHLKSTDFSRATKNKRNDKSPFFFETIQYKNKYVLMRKIIIRKKGATSLISQILTCYKNFKKTSHDFELFQKYENYNASIFNITIM